MRRALLVLTPVLLSAAPANPVSQARIEAARSEAEAQRLEALAAKAGGEAARLRADRTAAAAAIAAAEAQLAVAATQRATLQAAADRSAARLAQAQQPAAQLLAGLIQIGRRPPLLALADRASLDELVRARALLDSTLPVVRARSAALAGEVAANGRLLAAAASAGRELARRRDLLAQSQRRFAALESRANTRLAQAGGAALWAGDRALAAGDVAEALASGETTARDAARHAAAVSGLAEAPSRPGAPPPPPAPELQWQLPAPARVLVGLAEVSANGVRSRGLTLGTSRGAAVRAPAAGKIAFAGPFRRHSGIVIIDHGRGWMTLLTEVRTPLSVGESVAAGAPLGRALGPVTVELRQNGLPQPAALIAGSSQTLSKNPPAG